MRVTRCVSHLGHDASFGRAARSGDDYYDDHGRTWPMSTPVCDLVPSTGQMSH